MERIKQAIKTALAWLRASNRSKHLLGGILIGIFAGGWWCALYAATLTAAAMEYKDKAHGGRWDWADLGLTVLGAVLGQALAGMAI